MNLVAWFFLIWFMNEINGLILYIWMKSNVFDSTATSDGRSIISSHDIDRILTMLKMALETQTRSSTAQAWKEMNWESWGMHRGLVKGRMAVFYDHFFTNTLWKQYRTWIPCSQCCISPTPHSQSWEVYYVDNYLIIMVKDVQRSFNHILFSPGPAKTRQYIAQFSGQRSISCFRIAIIYAAWSINAGSSFNSDVIFCATLVRPAF
jgi:hypothetical protein